MAEQLDFSNLLGRMKEQQTEQQLLNSNLLFLTPSAVQQPQQQNQFTQQQFLQSCMNVSAPQQQYQIPTSMQPFSVPMQQPNSIPSQNITFNNNVNTAFFLAQQSQSASQAPMQFPQVKQQPNDSLTEASISILSLLANEKQLSSSTASSVPNALPQAFPNAGTSPIFLQPQQSSFSPTTCLTTCQQPAQPAQPQQLLLSNTQFQDPKYLLKLVTLQPQNSTSPEQQFLEDEDEDDGHDEEMEDSKQLQEMKQLRSTVEANANYIQHFLSQISTLQVQMSKQTEMISKAASTIQVPQKVVPTPSLSSPFFTPLVSADLLPTQMLRPISYYDKNTLGLIGCNKAFLQLMKYSEETVRNNFSMMDFFPKRVAPFLELCMYGLINYGVKVCKVKTTFLDSQRNELYLQFVLHIEESFVWIESYVPETMNDEVEFDGFVIPKTYEYKGIDLKKYQPAAQRIVQYMEAMKKIHAAKKMITL